MLIARINRLFAHNSTWIILTAIGSGLATECFSRVSDTALALILFLELFLACFKIENADLKQVRVPIIAVFFLLRYLILAFLFYFIGLLVSPTLATALLLLTLLPGGVSSPGFASIFNANVAVTLSVVLLSSILAPLYVPLMLREIAGTHVQVDAIEMLTTIALIVILPVLIHIPVRLSGKLSTFLADYNPLLLLPLVWITIAVPISRYRDQLMADWWTTAGGLLGFLAMYLVFGGIGLIYAWRQGLACRISYFMVSCIHNITLGIVISLVYLPNAVTALLVLANIAIFPVIMLFSHIVKRVTVQHI